MINSQLSVVRNSKDNKADAETRYEVGALEGREEEIVHAVTKG